jgi:hypothetical protein
MRTLQQYLFDKEEWSMKKKEALELQKLKHESLKYIECSFKPRLISRQIEDSCLRIRPGEKVEDRLLRVLDKSI